MASYRYERDIDPKGAGPPQRAAVHPERKVDQLVGL